MKKMSWVFCVMILVLLKQNAFSQVELGIKGGIGVPCLIAGSSKNPVSTGYHNNLVPGFSLSVNYILSKNFSLRTGLQYTIEGGEKSGSQAFAATTRFKDFIPAGEQPSWLYANYYSKLELHYIGLPVEAILTVPLTGNWNVYFAGGLFISHPVSARSKTRGSGLIYLDEKQTMTLSDAIQNFDGNENIKSRLSFFNAGVTESIGISYTVKRHKLFLETGGNFGFVNIYKNSFYGNNHTGTVMASLGYSLFFYTPEKHMIY